MKRAVAGVASLLAVAGLAGSLVVGSQALRAHRETADVVSPSPSDSPSPSAAPSPSPTVLPSCVPGEGNSCGGSAPIAETPPPTSDPASVPPNSRAPAGQIQPAWSLMLLAGGSGQSGRMGIMVTVLYGSNWVSGAHITVRCNGPGVDVSASGDTAPRSTWPPTVNPSIPPGPAALFWDVQSAAIEEQPAGSGQYHCHGTASFNGLTGSF